MRTSWERVKSEALNWLRQRTGVCSFAVLGRLSATVLVIAAINKILYNNQ